ncbi:hypothetical protein ABES25_04695 [Bacillus gobiensis]|uniref:hypothetical protein n=1 Tax=Bacillus gobiensis TaxID=1441095 RepID=UPI003D2297D4
MDAKNNELWKLQPGWIAGYTEDGQLIKNIKRSNKNWIITADYFSNGKRIGVHLKIPVEDRRQAERRFGVKVS